jgi:hypothetical protein
MTATNPLTLDTLTKALEGLRYVSSRMDAATFFKVFDFATDPENPRWGLTDYEVNKYRVFLDYPLHFLMGCSDDKLELLVAWINEVAGEA